MAGHKKTREARAAAREAREAERVKKQPTPLTPEQIAKKEVSGVGTRIKKLLRDSGRYDPSLTYQVEQAATTLTIIRKLAAEILTTEKAIETETSREGHKRARINPLYELYLKFDSANRHNLRALSMNRENMKTADDQLNDGEDAVMKMLQQMAQDDDGE